MIDRYFIHPKGKLRRHYINAGYIFPCRTQLKSIAPYSSGGFPRKWWNMSDVVPSFATIVLQYGHSFCSQNNPTFNFWKSRLLTITLSFCPWNFIFAENRVKRIRDDDSCFRMPQFYRCFQALLRCESPRRVSSMKSSSRVATKVIKGAALTSPRRTNDLLYMVVCLGKPAAAIPQLGPALELTDDISKAHSLDSKPALQPQVSNSGG